MLRITLLLIVVANLCSAGGCGDVHAMRPLTAQHVRTIEHSAEHNSALWSAFRESLSQLTEIERIARMSRLQERIALRYGHDDLTDVLSTIREDAAALSVSADAPRGTQQQRLSLEHPISGDVAAGLVDELTAAHICHRIWLLPDDAPADELAALLAPFALMQQWEADHRTLNEALDAMQEAAARHDKLALREAKLIDQLAHNAFSADPTHVVDDALSDQAFTEVLLNSIDHEPTRVKVAAVLDALLAQRRTQP